MTVRRSQGKARPQVARATELPRAVAAPQAAPTRPVERSADGKIATQEAARELGKRGGRARAERDARTWGRTLGLGGLLTALEADAHLKPFVDESQRWLRARVAEVASNVGGGVASAGVVSILTTSAWQRCFSSALFEIAATAAFAWVRGAAGETPKIDPRTDLVMVASKLGDASRQNLLAAFEIAAKEAAARPKGPSWYAHTAALPSTTTSTRTDSSNPSSGDDDADESPSSRDDDPSALAGDVRHDEPEASAASVAPIVEPVRKVPQWDAARAAWVHPDDRGPRPASVVPRHVVDAMRARGEVVPANWVIAEGEERSR